MDPVIFEVFGPIKLRWYGLGYLLGFLLGFLLLRWMAKKKLWVLGADKVADFITYAAVFGVFIGGRLGYILFYQIPKDGGMAELMADPLLIFKVWQGGMASHGGILGLVIFTWFYAKRNKVSWTGVGDGLCVVAPIGIGLVRLANFINGELYGRAAHGFSLAMKFPQSLEEDYEHNLEGLNDAYRSMNAIDPSIGNSLPAAIEKSRDNPELLQTLGSYLKERHPSQLYEALLEGLVLFLILLIMRIKFPKLPHGVLTGMFFILYAVFRIFVEFFREPDSAKVFEVVTKGQFYSAFMIVGGIAFVVMALKKQVGSVYQDRA